jgi:hypothetical protein
MEHFGDIASGEVGSLGDYIREGAVGTLGVS